jgi:hypothetical protein
MKYFLSKKNHLLTSPLLGNLSPLLCFYSTNDKLFCISSLFFSPAYFSTLLYTKLLCSFRFLYVLISFFFCLFVSLKIRYLILFYFFLTFVALESLSHTTIYIWYIYKLYIYGLYIYINYIYKLYI